MMQIDNLFTGITIIFFTAAALAILTAFLLDFGRVGNGRNNKRVGLLRSGSRLMAALCLGCYLTLLVLSMVTHHDAHSNERSNYHKVTTVTEEDIDMNATEDVVAFFSLDAA